MRNHRPSSVGQLALSDVTKCYGDRVVLDGVSFTVLPGEKIGVVGDNGSGKSTLLRLIAGAEPPDNGELTVVAPGGMAHLAQTLDLPEGATVRDAIDHALAGLRALEAEMHRAEAALATASAEELTAYGELQAEFEVRGGYEADVRVDVSLHGLGLPRLDRDRRIGELSGGERARLALAATLASSAELLLLDEPTNDLDDGALAWLEERLRGHWGTVLVATHDRLLLENVTRTILEVDDDTHTVHRYGNGYAGYLEAKAAARARWEESYQAWLEEISRQQRLSGIAGAQLATISKRVAHSNGGAGAARSRATATGTSHKVRNANERLRRLHADPVARPPDPLHFSRTPRTSGGAPENDPALVLSGVAVGDRLLLEHLELRAGERLLVTGPNGAGKSTLLRVAAGELLPGTGSVVRRGSVGHLRQEGTPARPRDTLLQAFAARRPGLPEEYEQELLALGLFRQEALATPVGALSVGQRRRLELARLVVRPVDLLLLDEPTNHLSPVLVEELERALADFAGTLVVVSHDRRLRASFQGARRLELRAGRPAPLTAV
ncbi:ribosomal protection-like ABC-F family protein [Streptomyces sp. NBC_01190]|uniref:ribosomal protection-like ABC-F family protein n=1 Tax=Streptomyces sp. NBC_01190 TaxID=2903767 RepID=UPI00386E799F|nr:ATP-binding cassette domain-containing protein [Streptomyces sp. NBC_01190]